MTAAHSVVTCFASPGVGSALSVSITAGGQTSPASVQTMRYQSPLVASLSGLGAVNAPTTGGTSIVISGNYFGPLTQLGPSGLPAADPQSIGFTLPLASYSRDAGSLPPASARTAPVMQALNCFVSVDDVQIICTTAPGVGAGLVWAVTIGSQTSAPSNATSSYAPPSVSDYVGPGAADADTVGSQAVIIDGHNFGPLGTVPDSATYGGPNATQFAATGCVVTTAHLVITCSTAPGAGAALKWLLTIGGQASVYPTTSYAVPLITGLSGPGALDGEGRSGSLGGPLFSLRPPTTLFVLAASTEGGQVVNITGSFFSFGAFLERVTYGPNGNDYAAAGCAYAVPHYVIACRTVPGTGRILRWLVTVDGQTSALSSVASSYQRPIISSVTGALGSVTSPLQATPLSVSSGGGLATVLASGLALLDPAATQAVTLETCYEGAAYPQQADINAYWAAVQGGVAPAPSLIATVQPWIAALTAPAVVKGAVGLTFTVPPGIPGCGGSFWVTVSGVPSDVWTFNYASPVITNAGEAPGAPHVGGALRESACERQTHAASAPLPVHSPRQARPARRLPAPRPRRLVVLPQRRLWTGGAYHPCCLPSALLSRILPPSPFASQLLVNGVVYAPPVVSWTDTQVVAIIPAPQAGAPREAPGEGPLVL